MRSVCAFLLFVRIQGTASLGQTVVAKDTAIPPDDWETGLAALAVPAESNGEGQAEALAHLQYLHDHPYDLNTVTLEELESIPEILPAEARAVIGLRTRLKRLTSVMQLVLIPEGGESLIGRMSPFVTVALPRNRRTVVLRSRFATDVQGPGTNASASGSAVDHSQELNLSIANGLAAGFLFRKRKGEEYREGFASGYLHVRPLPGVADIILGDYTVQCGQGLVFWSERSTGKGSGSAGAVRKLALAIQPSHSSSGTSTLRGAAIALTTGRSPTVSLLAFFSRRSTSGAEPVEDSSVTGQSVSVPIDEGVVSERVIGLRLQFSPFAGALGGLTYYRSDFNVPVHGVTVGDGVLKRYEVIGVDVQTGLGPLHFFGEGARSFPSGQAVLLGALLAIPGSCSAGVLWRDYSPDFINRHGSGFREFSQTRNERGFHAGLDMPLARDLQIGVAWDQFRSREGTSAFPSPRHGRDLAFSLRALITEVSTFTLKVTDEAQETSGKWGESGARMLPVLRATRSIRVRAGMSIAVGRYIDVQSRIEEVRTGQARGGALLGEFSWHDGETFRITARLSTCGRDAEVNNLYQIENDLGGVYTITRVRRSAERYALEMTLRPSPWVALRLKYSGLEWEEPGEPLPGGRTRSVIIQTEIGF